MPPMLISITGDAKPFAMRPKYNTIFSQALHKATQSTGAWVTTGGTDAGVMRLAGDAMRASRTPVLGIATWGVIKGRARLSRPSQATIVARMRNQVLKRNQRAVSSTTNIGTDDSVWHHYKKHKAQSWADPATPPADLGNRLSFVDPFGGTANPGKTLNDLGLMDASGYADLTKRFPELQTGRTGRGKLGRWGPNHAIDIIVTRRVPPSSSTKSGLQVRLMFREEDQRWAIPGMHS